MQKSKTPPFVQITDGVLLFACHVQDLAGLYRGRVAEQVVGQNILAQFMYEVPKVLYWAREKTEGIAEVDFCLQFQY